MNASIRTIDLRCRIADHFGFLPAFKQQIQDSASSSLAAIYFRRDRLDTIGAALGVPVDDYNKPALTDAIREAAGCGARGVDGLDWSELRAVVETLDIEVGDDCYYDVTVGAGDSEVVEESSPARETGPWADWQEGEL
jgi:hypothetical protein